MQAWPRGLQPTSVVASGRGVELSYRAPGDRWFRVVLALAPQRSGGLEVRRIPSGDPETLARLAQAVEHRAQRSPEASAWLTEVAAEIDRLAAMQTFGGDGPSSSADDTVIDELLVLVERLRDAADLHAEAPDAAEVERTLAAVTERHDSALVAELGPSLWIACGAFVRALEHWERHTAALEAGDQSPAIACAALMHGYVGNVAQAHSYARKLASRASDASDAQFAGGLLERLHRPELAVEMLRLAATDEGELGAFDIHHRIAQVAAHADDTDEVARAAAIMREHAQTPQQLLDTARMQREAGDFPAAEATLELLLRTTPDHEDGLLLLASSRLWRCDHAGVIELIGPLLERRPDHAVGLRMLGAAEFLASRPERAIELLERALELRADDNEARMWFAEALNHIGRIARAHDQFDLLDSPDLASRQLLRALIDEHSLPGRSIDSGLWFIVDANIRALLGDRAPADTAASSTQAMQLLTEAIAKLGGNRSTRLTVLEDGELRWLDAHSPRRHAERLQAQVVHRPIDELLAEFAKFAKLHPQIPFFRTYASELHLWRGEYELALEQFESVWLDTRTRWGYVGTGAAAMLLGDEERALEVWEEGKRYYDYLDAEATYCYRGELYLRRGELELARPDLELAVRGRPRRLGAWVNLARLEHTAGREQPLRDAVAQVEALCPPYAWEARRMLGLDGDARTLAPDELGRWMSTLVERMFGNRSSVMYTIRDSEDRLRIIPAAIPGVWQTYARRSLTYFADGLLTELCRRHGL